MPKIQVLPILAASFFLFFSLGIAARPAAGEDVLYVEGQVYCDTCRIGFYTRVSEFISGAKVRIECQNVTTKEVTLGVEGVTNSTGWYRVRVQGDHEDESCEIKLVSSPRDDCNGFIHGDDSSRILITKNVGIPSNCRLINPLGFAIREPLPVCLDVLKELELA